MELKCELKNIRLKEYLMDSKREFATMLGEEEHTYSNWEKAKTCPSLTKAFEIAEKLNKRIDEIWHP
jgi:DNA-binding XRE family transcriptional regulator